MKILVFKGQICLHLQTRALTFWPKQILDVQGIKSTTFEDGITCVLQNTAYVRLTVKGAAKSASFISQYRQSILRIMFIGESTPLGINTLLKPSNHSLKRTCYGISRESRQEGLEIFRGPKDVSSLVDDPPAGNLKILHDQPDLERSDKYSH